MSHGYGCVRFPSRSDWRMNTSSGRRRLPLGCPIVALPALAWAQEAALSGTVTDATGGVLPGVTITAVHRSSGNIFAAVTDEKGAFRIPVRTGEFKVTAELPGFATITRNLVLLVGQTGVVNVQMVPASLEESITVSGAAPLVDTTSSALGGNVDTRQMRDLPLNGRNFVDLAMLSPGSRQNTSGDELGAVGALSFDVDGPGGTP